MEEIVDAARKRRIVRDRRSDLGSYFANMSHVSTIRASLALRKLLPMYLCGGRAGGYRRIGGERTALVLTTRADPGLRSCHRGRI
jgi:hypothetical protein